jgi:hypothetical protein
VNNDDVTFDVVYIDDKNELTTFQLTSKEYDELPYDVRLFLAILEKKGQVALIRH